MTHHVGTAGCEGCSVLQGGTAGAPEELNNRNEEEPRNCWPDMSQCQYYVGLQPQGGGPMPGEYLCCLSFLVELHFESSYHRAALLALVLDVAPGHCEA